MPLRQEYEDYRPSFSRKKRGYDHSVVNTFRVFDENEYGTPPRYAAPNAVKTLDDFTPIYPKHPSNKSRVFQRDHRHRNNTGWCTGVLFGNARTLNEPVCFVSSYDVQDKQSEWWPRPAVGEPEPAETAATRSGRRLPPLAESTSAKPEVSVPSQRNTRHGANPEIRRHAVGVVPVNNLWETDNSVRVHRERLSFEHIYDSRGSVDGYPARGHRQGAFVLQRAPVSLLDGAAIPTSKLNDSGKLPAVDILRDGPSIGYDKDLVVQQDEHRRALSDTVNHAIKTDISQYYIP